MGAVTGIVQLFTQDIKMTAHFRGFRICFNSDITKMQGWHSLVTNFAKELGRNFMGKKPHQFKMKSVSIFAILSQKHQ